MLQSRCRHHGGCPSWEVEAVVAVLVPEAEATRTQNKMVDGGCFDNIRFSAYLT